MHASFSSGSSVGVGVVLTTLGGVKGKGSMLRSLEAGVVYLSLNRYAVAATVQRACSVCRAVVLSMIRRARAWTASSLASGKRKTNDGHNLD